MTIMVIAVSLLSKNICSLNGGFKAGDLVRIRVITNYYVFMGKSEFLVTGWFYMYAFMVSTYDLQRRIKETVEHMKTLKFYSPFLADI